MSLYASPALEFRALVADLHRDLEERLVERYEQELGTLRQTVKSLRNELQHCNHVDPKRPEPAVVHVRKEEIAGAVELSLPVGEFCAGAARGPVQESWAEAAKDGTRSMDRLPSWKKHTLGDREACRKRAPRLRINQLALDVQTQAQQEALVDGSPLGAVASGSACGAEPTQDDEPDPPTEDCFSFSMDQMESSMDHNHSPRQASLSPNRFAPVSWMLNRVLDQPSRQEQQDIRLQEDNPMERLSNRSLGQRSTNRSIEKQVSFVNGAQSPAHMREKILESSFHIQNSPETRVATSSDVARSVSMASDLFQARDVWQMNKETLDRIKSRRPTFKSTPSFMQQAPPPWADFRDLMMTRASLEKSSQSFVMHPQSKVRLCWDLLAVVLLSYDLIFTPLLVFDLPFKDALRVIDILVLLYWVMDIGFSFFTGVYVNGHLHMRCKSIARRYASTWLTFDLLLVVPEVIAAVVGIHGGATDSMQLARAVRGARYVRVVRYLRLLRLVKVQKLLQDLRSRINNSMVLLCMSIVKLLTFMVMLIHVLACAWFGIGTQDINSWVYRQGFNDKPVGLQYLYSFQWSMARLHPSNFAENLELETTDERLFAILISLVAVGGAGLFVSTITNTMAQLQTLRQQRTRKLHVVRMYVQERHLHARMAVRLKKYVEKTLDQKLREQHALELEEMLPVALLMDVRYEAWSQILSMHAFFSKLCRGHPRAVWRLGRNALRELPVMAGEKVFATGDACERMLFVMVGKFSYKQGHLAVQLPFIREEATFDDDFVRLKLGDSLSEAVLWTPWENRGCCKAITDGTLLQLEVGQFIECVRAHEQAMVETAERARVIVRWLNAFRDECSDILPDRFTERNVMSKSRTSLALLPRLGSRSSSSFRAVVPEWPSNSSNSIVQAPTSVETQR